METTDLSATEYELQLIRRALALNCRGEEGMNRAKPELDRDGRNHCRSM